MDCYLWDYSFQELFLKEGGMEVMETSTAQELASLRLLENYFEKKAHCCRKIVKSNTKNELETRLKILIQYDVALQICLIFSLSIQETIYSEEKLLQQLEESIPSYFKDYPTFDKLYQFEAYSLLYCLPSTFIMSVTEFCTQTQYYS